MEDEQIDHTEQPAKRMTRDQYKKFRQSLRDLEDKLRAMQWAEREK